MLTEQRMNQFLDELSSNSPAPGGGSVAALSGALGSALTSMVCSLTGAKGQSIWQTFAARCGKVAHFAFAPKGVGLSGASSLPAILKFLQFLRFL